MSTKWMLGTYAATSLFLALEGSAQTEVKPSFPEDPGDDELKEVEDVVTESEVLPTDENVRQTPRSRIQSIRDQQVEELLLSQAEMRSRYLYDIGLTLGAAAPWQDYGLTSGYLARPELAYALTIGGGRLTETGRTEDRGFEIEIKSRNAALAVRYYVKSVAHVSFESFLGYAVWQGTVAPHGSDDSVDDPNEKLSSGYEANGLTLGFATALTSLWDNGFFLKWTPVGMRRSFILQRELTRDTELVNKVIERQIERAAFYGFVNVTFGTFF